MRPETRSRTEEWLKNRTMPGNNPSPVAQVTIARDGSRIVKHDDGTTTKYTQATLRNAFNKMLRQDQGMKALKGIRVLPSGKAKATIGGSERGERKTYTTKRGAVNAVKRAYGV